MKLAFLFSAYTDPPHLARLVASLPRGSAFFVHVDARKPLEPFAEATRGLPVSFLARRYPITWGGYSQLLYQTELLRTALAEAPDADYLVLLTAQDYPLWSNGRIVSFFASLPKDGAVMAGAPVEGNALQRRTYSAYRFFGDRAWPYGSVRSKFRVMLRRLCYGLGVRKPLHIKAGSRCLKLYKGSDYWAVSPAVARYILHEWDTCAPLRRYLRTSFAPSELMAPTVLFNSPLTRAQGYRRDGYDTLFAVSPLHYIDYGEQIKVLTEEDLTKIVETDRMFCRKTLTGESDGLMDRIDELRAEAGEPRSCGQ